jgi:hypothetical protein
MATNFLDAAGTNGFIATPVTLMTTELNTLATATNVVSSVGGTSGVFTQASWGSAIWGQVGFVAGGVMSGSPTAGGYLAGWFLYSPDGGTTFEKVVAATDLPRPPDFIIPLFASAYASGDLSPASGIVRLPWWSTKLYIGNRSGVSLNASGNIIKVGPVAVQY